MPVDAAASAVYAGRAHDLNPLTLLGYLCSEHPGGRWSGECSDKGACGYYQLMPMWPREFGYRVDDREDVWHSADMAARLIVYTKGRHAECLGDHDWRAHLKCGKASRDRCSTPVERWQGYEADLRSALEDPDI